MTQPIDPGPPIGALECAVALLDIAGRQTREAHELHVDAERMATPSDREGTLELASELRAVTSHIVELADGIIGAHMAAMPDPERRTSGGLLARPTFGGEPE